MPEGNEVQMIEIPEAPVKEEIVIDTKELPQEEKALAEKHGMVKKEDNEQKVEEKIVEKDKIQTFEDTEKDEKNLVKNYSKGEQALYWKWKHDKKERQTAQAERDLAAIKAKSLEQKLTELNGGLEVSKSKLAKVEALLSGPADEITIEALQAILKTEPKKDDADKPLTKKDLEALKEESTKEQEEQQKKQAFIQGRIAEADELCKTKFDNYEEITDCAKAVLEGKVSLPKYVDSKKLSAELVQMVSADVELDEIADFVKDIATLHPDFGKKTETKAVKESKENIDRILENANKSKSSASISGGNGRRVISEDNLTLEDAAKLTTEQYRNLKPKTKERLMRETSK